MLRSSEKIVRYLAYGALLGGALLPALFYLFIEYSVVQEMVEDDAVVQSQRAGYGIAANPEVWRYASERLIDQIVDLRHDQTHTLLTTSDGSILGEIGKKCTGWCITGRAPLKDFGNVVGEVKVDADFIPDLINGVFIAFFGLLIGFLLSSLLKQKVLKPLAASQIKLQESEGKYRALVEATGMGYLILDMEGKVIDANPEYVRLTGRRELSDIIGKSVIEWTASHQQEKNAAAVAKCISDGFINDFAIDYVSEDGKVTPVEINATVVSEGSSVRIISLCRDITVRKQAEAALKESEERWKFAIEGSGDGMWDWNIAENSLFLSKRWMEMLGFAEEEIGKSIDEWEKRMHPEDKADVLAILHSYFDGKIPKYICEHRIQSKDGSYLWILDRGMVTSRDENGKPLRMIGMYTDISDRKQAEAALHESEARFRNLANAAPTLIWVAGTDKLCNWFNGTWLEYTGRSMEQEFGNGWAEGVHSDDLDRCLKIYVSHFDERQPFSMEYRLRNHQGEYHWFIDVGRPRFDEQGQFLGYIGMLTDINDRKVMEHSMRLAQFSLDHAEEEILWIDSQARIVDANGLACKALGYSKEELIRLTMSDICPSFPAENWTAHWQEIKEKGSRRVESVHLTREGKIYPVEILANYFKHEGTEYNCAFARDITVRKQLEDELKRQAHIDFLTGLSSRGHFMEQGELELSRAIRYENPLSIFMMDVDHFKQVNDSHGHKVGDTVLKKLAEVCRQTLRDVDIVGRIGGEEFAILLPETDTDEAAEVAERLREAIAKAKVPLSAGGLPLHFSVSIGLASLASKDDNLDVLINLADKALYEAKNSGRNRVCVAMQ